jgi:CRP-like cAMP-binding protein
MSTTLSPKNLFLSELSTEDLSLLRVHLAPAELRVGDILHRCGDRIDDVVFPHSGVAIMTASLREGAGAGIALIGREGFAGGFAASASAPATCDCEIVVSGQASKMSASAFRFALDRSPTLRRWASHFDNALMAQAQQTALCNAAHSVEARICRWLLEVQDRSGGERVPLTQGMLARLLGVRRTTITLIAGHLEAAGTVRCRRGFLQIVDRAAIEGSCCECYSHLKSNARRPASPHGSVLAVGSARALDARAVHE